ncbi:CoA transferase [Neobacillus niacini]|uniref:CoA transferase n=1 Tax=Neobacillus niacini TaxID=86668 RepID=UPI003983A696
MVRGRETELLTGIQVLEVSEGSSGSYAGRLLAESGAFVTKVLFGNASTSDFRDVKKRIVMTASGKKSNAAVRSLLSEPWDIILWDSHSADELDQLLSSHLKSTATCIGIRIQFPQGVDVDEEYTLQGLAGWMALTGEPEKPPLAVGGYSSAYLVGAHAGTAGLLALIEKSWTGIGRLVQINALTIAASALEGAISTCLASGISRSRLGNRHNKLAPMAILPAADGWAFIGAPVDEKWELLERWAGIVHRPKWSSNDSRMEDCTVLEETLGSWTQEMTREELFLTGQAFRLPFAKVQTPVELRSCPQLSARNFWNTTLSGVRGVRLPWKINASSAPIKRGDIPIKKAAWKGLRILDLTSMWSGPYCTRLFADLGVEIIKVEAPHRPDGIRSNKGSKAPFFRELNRNKRGIQLDLRLESDRKRFLELVKNSDVLVENFSPRVMPNFGLTNEELWIHRPDLLIVSLSAFGQTGPYRDFVGYGPTLESMSGLAALTNDPNGNPWLPGFSISDIGAGIHGAFALAASLLLRNREGIGLSVDLSQYETACQFTADYLINGVEPSKPEIEVTVREVADLVNDSQITKMSIPGGNSVLGMPWESIGWKAPRNTPPELDYHT